MVVERDVVVVEEEVGELREMSCGEPMLSGKEGALGRDHHEEGAFLPKWKARASPKPRNHHTD